MSYARLPWTAAFSHSDVARSTGRESCHFTQRESVSSRPSAGLRSHIHVGQGVAWIICILLMASSSFSTLVAQAVSTRVEIAAPLFKDALGEERSTVEHEVATVLASQGSAYFSFLDWDSDEAAGSASPKLIVRLHEKKVGIGSKIYAAFLMEVRGQEGTIPQIPDIELYKSWQPDLPNHDPERLIHDLQQVIVERFENADFRARLQSDFLAQIAIANDLIVEPNRVVLPVSGRKLKASDESELLVHFLARQPQGVPGRGRMELNPLITIASPPREGLVQCLVDSFFFEGLTEPIRSTTWDPQIESVLRNKTEVQVFMRRYVKDVSLGIFNNGLAEEP